MRQEWWRTSRRHKILNLLLLNVVRALPLPEFSCRCKIIGFSLLSTISWPLANHHAGELFFATGEVAVKAPRTSTHIPRLRVAGGGQRQQQHQQGGGSPPTAQQQQVHESRHEIELRLKRMLESLSTAETRLAELVRQAARARFDCEDADVRYATAIAKVRLLSKSRAAIRSI